MFTVFYSFFSEIKDTGVIQQINNKLKLTVKLCKVEELRDQLITLQVHHTQSLRIHTNVLFLSTGALCKAYIFTSRMCMGMEYRHKVKMHQCEHTHTHRNFLP